jgi:inosine-uridine nucleoside N-ribohydrolase
MLKKLKQNLKRGLIFILILGVIFIIVLTVTNLTGDKIFSKKLTPVLIDSDTGHGIDAVFAISRALISSELELAGLTSSQWEFAEDAGDSSLIVSQKLNVELLRRFDRTDIPHARGAKQPIKYGPEPQPRPSPAADLIIRKALSMPKNKKLNVVSLGALTNVASAIMMDMEIVPRLRLYMSGMRYDQKTRVWNKNDFNARNDLDALDYILNTNGLEVHVMPSSTSEELVFTKEEAEKYMLNQGKRWGFLINKWNQKYPDSLEMVMQDVAIIEALIDPELVKREESLTPPENNQRTLRVYTYINKELMVADFYAELLKYRRNKED